MNFREWVVRHLPVRDRSLGDLMLDQHEIKTTKNLEWEINGEYLTAQWDHPQAGQGFFTIRPNGDGRFALVRDTLVRARAFPLGSYDSYAAAQKQADQVMKVIGEQYA